MKVFIAGATGALGLPLARELVRLGHQVTGLTRTPSKRASIEQVGASAAIADVYDEPALVEVIRASGATHVVYALTALPKAGPMKPADLDATNRLRIEGTATLLRASIAAGVRRIVAESFVNIYGVGDHGTAPLDETAVRRAEHRSRTMERAVEATESLERQLLEANGRGRIEAVILRYAGFYGAGTDSTRVRFDQVRRRKAPVIRHDQGLLPFIHLDDAVAATIAALERGRAGGVYNVADDEAASLSDVTREMARIVGAPAPRQVPRWVVRLAMPFVAEFAATRLPLSNARARRELGWAPRFPTYREGLREVATHLA